MYSSTLRNALAYSSRGWAVYPCHSLYQGRCTCLINNAKKADCKDAGKHPLHTKDCPNGYQSATTDEAVVRRMFRGTANVGIATGRRSGLVVLDVEAKGLEVLSRLESDHGTLPATPTARTGGSGRHYYFAYPTDRDHVPSPVGLLSGIDVRADDAGVVAPPSVSGKGTYWWVTPADTPLAPCPSGLLAMILSHHPLAVHKAGYVGPEPAPDPDDLLTFVGGDDPFAFPDGVGDDHRTRTFLRVAGARIARGDDPEAVRQDGYVYALSCDPPWDTERWTGTWTGSSGTRRGSDRSGHSHPLPLDIQPTPTPLRTNEPTPGPRPRT